TWSTVIQPGGAILVMNSHMLFLSTGSTSTYWVGTSILPFGVLASAFGVCLLASWTAASAAWRPMFSMRVQTDSVCVPSTIRRALETSTSSPEMYTLLARPRSFTAWATPVAMPSLETMNAWILSWLAESAFSAVA